jgi:hypothetical protein
VSELDRLEAAVGECREMVREAHAATKDLRAAVRVSFATSMGPGCCHDLGTTLGLPCHLGVCGVVRQVLPETSGFPVGGKRDYYGR